MLTMQQILDRLDKILLLDSHADWDLVLDELAKLANDIWRDIYVVQEGKR